MLASLNWSRERLVPHAGRSRRRLVELQGRVCHEKLLRAAPGQGDRGFRTFIIVVPRYLETRLEHPLQRVRLLLGILWRIPGINILQRVLLSPKGVCICGRHGEYRQLSCPSAPSSAIASSGSSSSSSYTVCRRVSGSLRMEKALPLMYTFSGEKL